MPRRPLLTLGILASGALYCLNPVLAAGTLAGTDITNRATATYSDGTTNFDAISNTVTVKVEEVRGLTVTDAGFIDSNGGSIATNDSISFDFLLTNTGNSDAYVHIPGATDLTAVGGTITGISIVESNGVSITPVTIPAAGASTGALALANSGKIGADGNLKVRVTVQVTATNAGNPISVQFGNTLDNTVAPADSTQNQQNIRDDSDTASKSSDVYTLDADNTLTPINGEREAAAFRQELLATAPPKPLAQVLLLLNSTSAAGANANSAIDDTITYNLDFRVGNNPQTGFPAGNLEGTTIKLDSGSGTQSVQRILVSSAIPPNTVWNGAVPTTPNANWTVVYSTDDPADGTENPLDVTWTTIAPTAATVKRIGFIYDAVLNGSLPPNTAVNGFKFTVITSGLPSTGGTVANIGQIFGETYNDPGNKLVYDESGDQNLNNYDDGVFPTNPDVSNFSPTTDTGVANASDPDPGSNTGSGSKGESNVINISPLPVTTSVLLNGPNGAPAAKGPNNDHDDFTNIAALLTAGNPNEVTITNTVRNVAATNLDTVTLLPHAPDSAKAIVPTGVFGVDRNGSTTLNDEIPDGTQVTITFGAQSVTYTYNAGVFTAPAGTKVVIGTLLPGQEKSYTVTVDLPAGTTPVQGYTIPILAFVDNNGNGDFDSSAETVYNFTNDRVYPGFISLVKKVRILDKTGTPQTGLGTDADGFTSNPTLRPQPGEFLEYQVTYQNISEVQPVSGGGNITLTGIGLTIKEDGADGTNNWAAFTTHQQNTAATLGTLQFRNGAVLLGSSDPASGTAVTRYDNIISSLTPQASGSLTFRRKVN